MYVEIKKKKKGGKCISQKIIIFERNILIFKKII